MPHEVAPKAQPPTSLRARLAARRKEFMRDTEAASDTAGPLLSLSISFIVILFISFLLFGIIGPDAQQICTDTTNYTADECSNATQARLLFWVFLVIVGVVHILVAIGIAKKAVK